MAHPLFQADAVNVSRLDTLVELVPAGIVSRVLIAEHDFRQTLFALDADQEISEHRSACLAIVQVLSGRLHMEVSGEAHDLEAGAWLSMPPNAPHALRAESPTCFLLTMLRVEARP